MMLLEQFIGEMERNATSFGKDNTDGLRACVPVIQEDIGQHFEDKVDSDGRQWPPHAPLTVALHGPHPLLVLTGLLRSAAARRGYGSHLSIEPGGLVYGVDGSAIPYAAKHQHGFGVIPQREFMYLSDEAIRTCGEILGSHAAQGVLSAK